MAPTVCVSFKVLPGGLGEKAEVYRAVDRAIEVIQRSGLAHLVGPSETTIEGMMRLATTMKKSAFESGNRRR